MKEALNRGPDTIDLVPLDQEEDPEKLLVLTHQYHNQLCQQSKATDATIRFHQGRARSIHRRFQRQDNTLSKHEEAIADKTYALFLGYEWVLARFYGKTINIAKLTFAEIAQIRQVIENEIITLPLSLEDETSFVDALNVMVDPDLA